MSGRQFALTFVAMLAVMLALLLPLRLALGTADLAALGVSARDVTGPVWSGHLRTAEWRGRPLGDTAVALRPWPLLLGVRQMQLTTPGLSVEIVDGRQVGIGDANGRIALDRIDTLPGLGLQLRLIDVDLRFANGQCVLAGGTVEVAVSMSGRAPIQLKGPVRCAGDHGVLALTAAASPEAGQIEATLSIAADGRYRLSSRVDPADDAASAALQLAGFQQTPSGLSRLDSGHLLR